MKIVRVYHEAGFADVKTIGAFPNIEEAIQYVSIILSNAQYRTACVYSPTSDADFALKYYIDRRNVTETFSIIREELYFSEDPYEYGDENDAMWAMTCKDPIEDIKKFEGEITIEDYTE